MYKSPTIVTLIIAFTIFQLGFTQNPKTNTSVSYTEICEEMKAINFEPQHYTHPSGSPSYMKLLPGSNNWMFFSRDFESPSTSETELNYLSRLKKLLENKNVTLIMLRLPQRGQLYSHFLSPEYDHLTYSIDDANKAYDSMIEQLNSIGILAPNLLTEFSTASEEVYFPAENHWKPIGQELAAKAIEEMLATNLKYKQLPKTGFELSFSDTTPRAGFANWVKNICKIDVYHYPFFAASATPLLEPENTNILFEDENPPVVLLGTSQSKPRSNLWDFSAYIKKAISLNISNEAIGGSESMSILDYFINSPNWLDHQPSFLIWETDTEPTIPISSLRQMLPAANGNCQDSLILDSGSIDLQENSNSKLDYSIFNEPTLGTYLYFKSSVPTNEFLGINITYSDGHHELLHLGHPRINNSGTYFVEFLSGHGKISNLEVVKHTPSLIETLDWKICLPNFHPNT